MITFGHHILLSPQRLLLISFWCSGAQTHKSVFPKSENNNILTCPFSLCSHSLSPCSIVLSHFTRLSINLYASFYISHAQKHISALRRCVEASSVPPILLLFHGGDEIFKRYSCLHLIACQHAHQLIWAGWSGLGPSAAKCCLIKTQRWFWRGNVENGFSRRKNIISNSYLVFPLWWG